jgi:energy-coupling factor transporter ATP-binding protein EcfA2
MEGAIAAVEATVSARAGHREGPEIRFLCPAHNDHHPSARWHTVKHVWHCDACRANGGWKDLAERLGLAIPSLAHKHPPVYPSVKPVTLLHPHLSLPELAAAKHVSEHFLAAQGVTQHRTGDRCEVRIPYYGLGGELLAVHRRIALDGDRFRWRSGDKPTLYGLNRLEHIRAAGWCLLVEGETDCWTAWLHDIPALGVPGKSTWQATWTKHLAGLAVYVWQEPGAQDLTRHMAADVPHLRVIVAPDGIKDLNTAHVAGLDVPALLEELKAAAVPAVELAQAERDTKQRELFAQAHPILEADDPLAEVEQAIRALGYAGDLKPALIVYLAFTARLLVMRPGAMPVHLLLIGPPGSGKTYTLQTVLRLMPEEAYVALDAASPRALIYCDDDLQHRVVVFGESDSIPAGEDNPAASAIRALLQDHRLRYVVTVRDENGGYTVRRIDKPGPTVLITTATRRLGEQLDSRLFALEVPDDQRQVRAALDAQAQLELGRVVADTDIFRALQDWLQLAGPFDVVVPYAQQLAAAVGRSPAAPRITRDWARLIALIKTVTVLRQRHRRRQNGRLVATLDDYRAVYGLVQDMYAASATGASAAMRETVEAVARLSAGGAGPVSVTALAAELAISKNAASARVRAAIRAGWLVNSEQRKGFPAQLALGEALPEPAGLPPPEDLPTEPPPSSELRDCHSVPNSTVSDAGRCAPAGSAGAWREVVE